MNAAAEPASSRDGESACPNLEALESFMRGESCEEVLPHVVDCPACQEQLKDMRSANEFLERFASASGAGSPSRPRQPHSLHDIKIEGYEIRAMLAFGGQGAVYKARQIRTGRLVAIKVPFHDALSGSSGHYRFKREIELTARLNHPNIVRVLGACDASDGRLGCVMEYIEGEPIGAWAEEQRRRGRSGLRRIVEVMYQVADAIAYAHQRAILHRDIKPSNIMITADDVPHVLDFGLAKALDSKAASFATVTGAFIGTLVYSAPEQLSGATDAVDLRTDVYSLGLLLFHVLTGRLPFPSDAPAIEIMRSIRDTAPGRPSSLNSEIGAELDAIILKAISKEKDRRYTTGGELRDDLRAWLAGEAVRAKLDSRSYRLRKTISRNR